MKKLIALFASALAAGMAFCASTTHLALDTRTGTRYARAEEPIAFSTDWNEGVTRLVLTVDGVNVLTATTATNGVYVWKPDLSTSRIVTLKHTTTRGTVDETLTATFTIDVVKAGGSFVYAPSESAAIHVIPHDWFLATGLAQVGDATAGLDAKLAATYANGHTGWESYVAGLNPNDPASELTALVELREGEVCVSWTPDLNSNGVTRIYTVFGRTELEKGDWETPVQPWHRFFKVAVALPTGAADEKTAAAGEGFVPEEKPLGGVQLWENGPYWAECNVGATKPEEYGYYFWWGDTVGYVHDGSKWVAVDGSSNDFYFCNWDNENPVIATMWKDNATLKSEGWIGEDGNLTAAHDAATAHLGAPWRMPTDAEFSALISNCDTSWTTRNGVYGRLVTGRGAYASRSIFLPAAGNGDESYLYDPGSYGYYWSSTPYSDDSYIAWGLYFDSGNFCRDYLDRCYGRSVRPLRGFAY